MATPSPGGSRRGAQGPPTAPPPPASAPYVLVDRADGTFDLTANAAAGAPQPTAEERKLADDIASRLAWWRTAANALDDPPSYVAGLRSIAQTGLIQESGRDFAAAQERFRTEFGEPVSPQEEASSPDPFPPGQFHVYRDDDCRLRVDRLPNRPDPSDDQLRFLVELDQHERLVCELYRQGLCDARLRAERSAKAIDALAGAAAIGLQDERPNVALARLAVQGIVATAIQENGVAVRGHYLRQLAGSYICASVGIVVLTALYHSVTQGALSGFIKPYLTVSSAFLIPGEMLALLVTSMVSLAVGAWLVAAFRLQPDSPEILQNLFATTTSSWIRVALVIGFGFLALLLFHKQVVVFSFGPTGANAGTSPFTTASVFTKLSAAVLAGGLLGLSDAALPSTVIARSANLVAALAPK